MLFFRKPRIAHPKVVMTLLVRDELDVIDLSVRHHSRCGIDALIVTDNGSVDGTREILEQHCRNGLIAEIIDEPSRVYDQVGFVDRMILRARDHYAADYCINSDADEFWRVAGGSFRDELARSRASKIYCPSSYMLPLVAAGEEEPFWKATDRCAREVEAEDLEKFGIPSYLNLFQEPKRMPKVIHRARGYRKIGNGNHTVEMDDTVSEKSKAISIYHYGVRSVAQFKRKFIQGGAALEANKNTKEYEGAHWRHLYRGYQAGTLDLEQEFYRVIAASGREELRRAGIIETDATMKELLAPLAG